MTDLLKLWNITPTIVNSVATPASAPIPWELVRKRKSRLLDEFSKYAHKKFKKWSHEFRFRRTVRGTVQVNVALQFALFTRMCFKMPIEIYRCIRSFLERGVL